MRVDLLPHANPVLLSSLSAGSVREYVFYVFFSKFKKPRFQVFLKLHVKKNVENVVKVSE